MSNWHDYFEQRRIRISVKGVEGFEVSAFVSGWWAAHKRVDGGENEWVVSHLEQGMGLPYSFPTVDDACSFIERLNKHRNNWSIETSQDVAHLKAFCLADKSITDFARRSDLVGDLRHAALNEVAE